MQPPMSEQVIVITGASSGIGRLTALECARRGASLVLAARTVDALDDLVTEIKAVGSEAIAVPTDVSKWTDVEALASEAVRHFGRIDTWINNAAVSEHATLDDMAPIEIERIIDVTLLGQMFGSKAALTHMKHQAGGEIINVASVVAEAPVPLQSAYIAAKHGIKGFTESLRLELERDGIPIQVTLVLPGGINAPFFQHTRSRMGVMPMATPPIYDPIVAAKAIVRAVAHPFGDAMVARRASTKKAKTRSLYTSIATSSNGARWASLAAVAIGVALYAKRTGSGADARA